MQLTKISRSKSFEMVNGYGLKEWDKFGLEAELSPNEDPISAYRELDLMIDQAHKDSYKFEPPKEIQVKKQDPLTKEEKQKKCITDTVTLDGPDGLKSFALLVSKNPHLQETYDNHFKKLTDGL